MLLIGVFASPAYVWAQAGPSEVPRPVETAAVAMPTASKWAAPLLHMTGYASFAALQALDVVSTLQALKVPGAREANPMMEGLVDHPLAFITLKSATTIAVLTSMRQFSKTHPKAAVLVMAGLNSGYACIVRSNFHQVSGR
jgi:hypothetical protein